MINFIQEHNLNGFNSGLLKYTYVISLLYLIMHSLVLYRYAGNLLEGFSQTQISTLAVKDNLLVAGGFQGELTCKVSHFWQLCYSISSAVLIIRPYRFLIYFIFGHVMVIKLRG